MRKVGHWTPHYVYSRIREAADHKLRPEDPWLTRHAIELLSQLLKPTDIAAEFGSGRSTVWFAKRVKHITSIEDSREWHEMITTRLAGLGLNNVDYLLKRFDDDPDPHETEYTKVADSFADESLDFALVDGQLRDVCALKLVPKMRAGGILVIDNAGWYVPSTSRTPKALRIGDPPYSDAIDAFLKATSDWRRIWTTSGVTDTLLLFKP